MLLDSALSLFIQHGYANTTIQMILDQSGVSKGTFYKFFSSKEECFHSIFEQRLKEDIEIRKNLESKHYASDFELLVDQIVIPMTLPDKERVWELFWTGFYSGEINTSKLASVQLRWFSERLTQLYGDTIRPYTVEGAILFYGMLHQVANLWRSLHTRKPDWNELVSKILNYVGVLLQTMYERNEHIFDTNTLSLFQRSENARAENLDHKEIVEKLHEFHAVVEKSKESNKLKELTKGLLELFQDQDTLNVSMIEVVIQAFHKESAASSILAEAHNIVRACWWYIEHVKINK
jgi:AcrR family transcriptional regulator